jgi:RNA polymerase sigma factor (sigma-70 family)
MSENERTKKQLVFDTIEILENIDSLKLKLDQDHEDIADMKQEKFDTSTWHDIKRPGGPQLDDEVRHLQKIRSRERSMLRTEQLLRRVERALNKLKSDPDYFVLEMRYFRHMSEQEIADQLHYSTQTVFRKRKKVIAKLTVLLYGSDALNCEVRRNYKSGTKKGDEINWKI